MATFRRTSAVDEVLSIIKDKIHQGEYPVGHVLPPQKIMAAELGVSASTIREAFGKLSMLGYLSAKQGVGTTVISNSMSGHISGSGQYIFLNSGELVHFMEARLCLERVAIRLAAQKAGADDFGKLSALIEKQSLAAAANDSALFSQYDKDFHMEIMLIGRNPILIQYMEMIREGLYRFIEEATSMARVMHNSIEYHRDILRNLEKRDGLAAEKKVVEHLWDVTRIVEANLGQETGLADLFKRELSGFDR
jgi:DNA-binding FadR family transcriptional regulator